MRPYETAMLKYSAQDATNPTPGLSIREMYTYPPPDLGIEAPRIAKTHTVKRTTIPTSMNAITIGGSPRTYSFSGKIAGPVN